MRGLRSTHVRLAIASCVAAVTLAGCASGGDPVSGTPAGSDSEKSSSALEKVTADQLCGMLSDDAIAKALDVEVKGTKTREWGRAPEMKTPYSLHRHCKYQTDGFPSLSTDLSTQWNDRESDAQVLEGVFTDITDESKPVGEYEQVQGLGEIAGFGSDATLSGADVAGRHLAIVFRAGQERLLLTLTTLGRAKLDQLRPLADELLGNVKSAVG